MSQGEVDAHNSSLARLANERDTMRAERDRLRAEVNKLTFGVLKVSTALMFTKKYALCCDDEYL